MYFFFLFSSLCVCACVRVSLVCVCLFQLFILVFLCFRLQFLFCIKPLNTLPYKCFACLNIYYICVHIYIFFIYIFYAICINYFALIFHIFHYSSACFCRESTKVFASFQKLFQCSSLSYTFKYYTFNCCVHKS